MCPFSLVHSRLEEDIYQNGKAGSQGMLMKINAAKLFCRNNTALLNTFFIDLMVHSFHENFTDREFPDSVSLVLLHCSFIFSFIQIYWWPPCSPRTRAYPKNIYQNTLTCWGMRCPYLNSGRRWVARVNLFQPNDTCHKETSHLVCTAKQMTGFYMKYNIGLKWVKTGFILSWIIKRKWKKRCIVKQVN